MARPGTSARRFAEAAFAIAEQDGSVDDWRDQLQMAASILGGEAGLLQNPGIPFEVRASAADAALGQAVDARVRRLVELLLRGGRIELLPRVADEFVRLDNARKGIATAVVTSAAPLEADEEREIRDRLEQRTGGPVEMTFQVDPAILGGVVVRLGDRLMDGSVRGRLERLRERLVTGAA